MVKHRERIRNTILVDALAKKGLDLITGALFIGVKEGTLKRWIEFKGLPPKKLPQAVAFRLRWLTGMSPEDVVPVELFEMPKMKQKLSKRQLNALPKQTIQALIGAEYLRSLMQNPDEVVGKREKINALIGAMRQLPPGERSVIEGKFLQSKSDEELAKIMKLSVKEIRVLSSRGLDSLRKIVWNYPPRLH